MKKHLILFVGIALALGIYAQRIDAQRRDASKSVPPAAVEEGIAVYFSPEGGCENAIVQAIRSARKSLCIQLFSFTNNNIAAAIAEAHERGVKVRVILDKESNVDSGKYTGATYLFNHKVPVFIDGEHTIAHNKVGIIDEQTIITGSFNWTRQAETSNAENLLVITGKKKLTAAYLKNFEDHMKHAKPYEGNGAEKTEKR